MVIAAALSFYIIVAVVILIVGIVGFVQSVSPEDKKIGARFILASVVWPLVVLVLIPVGILQLFYIAFPEE